MEDGRAARGGADQHGTPRNSISREDNPGPRCVGSEPRVKGHTLESDFVFPSGEDNSVARDGAGAARDGAEQRGIQDTFDVNKEHDDCDHYERTNQDVTEYFACTDDIVIEQHKTATFIRGAINEFIAMPVDVPLAAASLAPCIEGAVAYDCLWLRTLLHLLSLELAQWLPHRWPRLAMWLLLALWVQLQ